jgi:hypothetical protein
MTRCNIPSVSPEIKAHTTILLLGVFHGLLFLQTSPKPCCCYRLQGPADSSASVLSHPLEEPSPVVADCALSSSSSGGRSNVAAYAGWSQESVVWTSRELPFVATYNEVRAAAAAAAAQPSLLAVDLAVGAAICGNI